ncbi:MSHA biogenesis protein MshJ [Photobacterium kishitanii]|uniref:MSHA biogenesis protein MshJ n=1 Tax=Photobacterium kishitanii TaxID=318456 RepID=A0A2T3KCR3_9GAMM|nr:MSHA biogenesis protein MshJ [Photobacterium kishitanii]OBU28557.1 MSHA biogenesis protein MshJ [Photobacterium kishitanii]PSU88632.1 MSHA biogenesis protein MshJ [Photobacterium kishitanii]PSU93312.1 MSHA biogenesis protein MshJ [Photobacterium kishitanii]PSU93581.1 MSHA biogenesis protein MshJ [Photobacterium kishitanii]PSV24371.1 MSHA biogenesis protein MshJ [Photobacterium kishitanii]
MRITWIECQQRFSGLSSREQWLIAISGWVAIGFIGVLMVLEPQWLQLKSQMNNVQTTMNNTIAIRNNITVLQRQLAQDPNKDIEVKIAQLTQKNTQLVQQLQQKIGGLVTPTQMPNILEQVLRHSKELRLQSIVSLPAAQLISGEDQGYYIHPLRMTFEGKYFDVIRYLTQLEALPVNYYWRNLNYQVMQYPWAKIELELYTLGESKDFIGG